MNSGSNTFGTNGFDTTSAKIWVGVAVGAALGIGIALSRRKRSRWDATKDLTRRVAAHSDDLAVTTQDMVDRVKRIYEEGRKVVEDAGELWAHGRKLTGF